MHTDDSDVTFNICLGRNFTGANLTICGDSRMPQHRQFHTSYAHVPSAPMPHKHMHSLKIESHHQCMDDVLSNYQS